MPDNISSLLGRATMAYQGETPWHMLGTAMEGNPDVNAALRAANLDWKVELQDLYLKNGTKVPHRKAIVRDVDSRILGMPSGRYTPLQNSEAFGVLQPACENLGITIETAGALGIGDRVWMLAKLPAEANIEPVNGDKVNGYFLVTSGHNGKTRYRGRPTPVRVVCANTLAMAMHSGTDMFDFVHTKSTKDQLGALEKLISNLVKAMKKTGETFQKLAEKKLTMEDTQNYIANVLGVDEDDVEDLEFDDPVMDARLKKILSLSFNGRGADFAPNTLWSAYNGLTEYIDHVRPIEARTSKGIISANRSAVFGRNSKMKTKALELAAELVS